MHIQRGCVRAAPWLKRAEGERERMPKIWRHLSFIACDDLEALDQGLGCSGSSSPLILILILLNFDPRAKLACMKSNQFLLSLSSTQFWVHPCWLGTSCKRVVSRTCFGCPSLCTMCDSSVPNLDSSLAMCYLIASMMYYVSFRERKSQKGPENGSYGPCLDMNLWPG